MHLDLLNSPREAIGVDSEGRSEVTGTSTPRMMRTLLVAVPLMFLAYGLVGWLRGWPLGVDSSVYRAGAVLFVHGHSLYDVNDLGYLHLSFTYPPAAALLFTPLVTLPTQLAWAVMASANFLALVLVIRIAVTAVPYWRFPVAWSTVPLAVTMLCLVPVWRTIGLGQVNLLLMAMVVSDVLVVTARGSRWGGFLTGIAAAVKLVPLIFIVHLLLTGKRAAAVRGLAVFVGLQGLALVIRPQDRAYWDSYVFQTNRIGPAQLPANQSLDGLIVRATDMSLWSSHAASAIGAVLAVPVLMLMLRYHRRGKRPVRLVRDRVLRAAAGPDLLGAVLGVDSTDRGRTVLLVAGLRAGPGGEVEARCPRRGDDRRDRRVHQLVHGLDQPATSPDARFALVLRAQQPLCAYHDRHGTGPRRQQLAALAARSPVGRTRRPIPPLT